MYILPSLGTQKLKTYKDFFIAGISFWNHVWIRKAIQGLDFFFKSHYLEPLSALIRDSDALTFKDEILQACFLHKTILF